MKGVKLLTKKARPLSSKPCIRKRHAPVQQRCVKYWWHHENSYLQQETDPGL